MFRDAGVETVIASPQGGQPPLDPASDAPDHQTAMTHRFAADPEAQAALAATVRLDSVSAEEFDAVFYPGGHGPLWDLAEDPHPKELIEQALRSGEPVALVCHAPGVLRHVTEEDGTPLVRGRPVTGFTNTEEEGVGLTDVVPFSVEDELTRLGGVFSKTADWNSHVVQDDLLITGQDPHSSTVAAAALIARHTLSLS